jgi:hypothetical protein
MQNYEAMFFNKGKKTDEIKAAAYQELNPPRAAPPQQMGVKQGAISNDKSKQMVDLAGLMGLPTS